MIVGTAGHIDHGKTTLILALTGVETDRLAEEKKRGISIELGYAYYPLPDGQVLGFIDVPGHEKLVHTMVAGAVGIDLGLLVVAADDGMMPQTLEHLAILQLLGVPRLMVVVTKIDKVEPERLRLLQLQIAQQLQNTPYADAQYFWVNASQAQDTGVATLRLALIEQAQLHTQRQQHGVFRLAIDRVFTLTGHGTVVTGTVFSGQVQLEDKLLLMPAGLPVRVRGIHSQNQKSHTGQAGQRCAINLTGVDKKQIERGDSLASAQALLPSTRIDVEVSLLAHSEPLADWSVVHVHVGTLHTTAHVVPLSTTRLMPGQVGTVQLVFEKPVCVLAGDRFLLRNPQASLTIGGGRVLDPEAPARKRRSLSRQQYLLAVTAMLDGQGLGALLKQSAYGLSALSLTRLTGSDFNHLVLPEQTQVLTLASGQTWVINTEYWQQLQAKVVSVMQHYHEQHVDEPGLTSQRLKKMSLPLLPLALWPTVLNQLSQHQQIQQKAGWWHHPSHQVSLSATEQAIADQIIAIIAQAQFDPPWIRDIAFTLKLSEDEARHIARKLQKQGDLVQVVKDLFYHPDAITRLLSYLPEALSAQGAVVTVKFKDLSDLGRKRAIQILEFFDKAGYTSRLGEKRFIK